MKFGTMLMLAGLMTGCAGETVEDGGADEQGDLLGQDDGIRSFDETLGVVVSDIGNHVRYEFLVQMDEAYELELEGEIMAAKRREAAKQEKQED